MKSILKGKPQTKSWIKKQITFHVLEEQASVPRDRMYKTVFSVVLTFVVACLVDCISGPDDADTGTSVLDSGTLDSEDAMRSCRHSESLDDVDLGVRPCGVGLAYVECTYPSGAGCGCISDDPTTCSLCGPNSGATCTNRCAADEYAISCGGPPGPIIPDGSLDRVYQEVPDDCVIVGMTPAGNDYACCPCE